MAIHSLLFGVLVASEPSLRGNDRNLKGGAAAIDPSACDDPSAFDPADFDVVLCDFPVIIAGFDVSGLPDVANPSQMNPGANVGKNPPTGIHRVVEGAENPCENIVKSYISQGTGANLSPSQDGEFSWKGSFIIARPAGQTSLIPDVFPDQEGGLWDVNGRVTYKGNDFTLLSYAGSPPFDICEYLGDV